MRKLLLFVLTFSASAAAFGQEFEAVSIKPEKSGDNGSHSHMDGGIWRGTGTLLNLIADAYRLNEYQVQAPDWLSNERFDISAKLPAGLPKDRDEYSAAFAAMQQQMLAERFKLAAHRESKSFSVYGLLAAKGGVKLTEVTRAGSRSKGGRGTYQGSSIALRQFAEFLSHSMDLPVIDMTGLSGYYDIVLTWAPEADKDPTAGPTLREALENQLGLKLENRKAPLDVIVVEHIERAPTAN